MSSPDSCPALVLNADFRPLSYFPLSLWPWQEAVKAVFMDRVNIISEYDRVVRSPSFEMRLPSVVSLKEFIPQARRPAFTRFNVFLRDRFCCQYCGEHLPTHELTFDHLVPRSRGGRTCWENVVTACQYCGDHYGAPELTFDHVVPRSRGGRTTWTNVVTACQDCNLLKGNRLPHESHMHPKRRPEPPSTHQLQENGRLFPPNYLHESWRDFLYWDS